MRSNLLEGTLGTLVRFAAIVLLVSFLLLMMSKIGAVLGNAAAASRTSFFIVGERRELSATVILFISGDLMLIRDICRTSSDPERWEMELSFRIVPVAEPSSLARSHFGTVARPAPPDQKPLLSCDAYE